MMQQPPQQVQPAKQSPAPVQAPPPVKGGGLFGFDSKKLFGGTTKKLMLGGGGALLAGIMGKKAVDSYKEVNTTQQTQYQQPQQTQYQQSQQDPNAGYGYSQPVQDQTTSGYVGDYTDLSTQDNYAEAQLEANNDMEALQLNAYENANEIYLDNQAVDAAHQLAEQEVEYAQDIADLA
jgi:hypothetical protein